MIGKATTLSYKIDFDAAASDQIESALCARLEQIRLSRNMTQRALAEEAGVSPRTINRMASGEGISLDTFIRILSALRIQQNLSALLPDPSVRPIERVALEGRERQRARPKGKAGSHGAWTWGDGDDQDD